MRSRSRSKHGLGLTRQQETHRREAAGRGEGPAARRPRGRQGQRGRRGRRAALLCRAQRRGREPAEQTFGFRDTRPGRSDLNKTCTKHETYGLLRYFPLKRQLRGKCNKLLLRSVFSEPAFKRDFPPGEGTPYAVTPLRRAGRRAHRAAPNGDRRPRPLPSARRVFGAGQRAVARGRAARKHRAVLRGPDSPPPRPAPGTGSLTDLSGPGRGSGPRVRRHRRPHHPRRGCCSPCRRRTTGVRTEARVASTRGRRAAAAFRRGLGRVHAHTAVGSDDTVAGGRGRAADGFRNTGARRHAPETALLLCYGTPKPLPRPRPSAFGARPVFAAFDVRAVWWLSPWA